MAAKAILIVLDGLRFDAARQSMGYLGHLLETAQASLYKVRTELPSLSRPLYETLLTGTPVSVHGITANCIRRRSEQTSVFHLARDRGLTAAAAAHCWFSELYLRCPFEPARDRECHDATAMIQHGKFYFDDRYPDSHLFVDAEILRQNWQPDFLLVQPMGIDDAGHRYGADSPEYRGAVLAADSLLAEYLPLWRAAGYAVLITANRGLDADGQPGGTLPEVREVPLFCLGRDFAPGCQPVELSQLAIAPLLCDLLGLGYSDRMTPQPIPGYRSESLGAALDAAAIANLTGVHSSSAPVSSKPSSPGPFFRGEKES